MRAAIGARIAGPDENGSDAAAIRLTDEWRTECPGLLHRTLEDGVFV